MNINILLCLLKQYKNEKYSVHKLYKATKGVIYNMLGTSTK